MCQWCVLYGKKVDKLPPCDTTFLLPASFMEDDTLEKIVDWETAENLPRNLADQFPSRLVPLKTTGDGNCLLHAVSRAIFGVELFYDLLRTSMYEELLTNMDWYCKVAPQYGEEDWRRILDNASRSGSYLEFMHIFALANVIARPIFIYANDGDMDKFGQGESGVAATFVPSRVGQGQCHQRPVILAWQSKVKNHYVPLVEIAGRDAVAWPALAPAFPNSLATEETYADYIHTDVDVIEPPLLKMLEQKQAEREKQQDLVNLLSRAFTAPARASRSSGGKGKEKKRKEVRRNESAMDEEEGEEEEEEEEEEKDEEEEEGEMGDKEALNELKNYLKRYQEEQKKEEDEARKKLMQILERAKREREEQLKREMAKRPRKEKLTWRGRVYDMMCYADLGDSLPRIIAWNKSDDIPQTAQAFMDEHGFGQDKEKHMQLVRLMARKTLMFVMEEIARGEEGGEEDGGEVDDDAEDGAQEEEMKRTSPGRKKPALLPSSASSATASVAPLPICRHIPKRRGAPVLYTQGQLDGIHKKLLQFNGEIALESTTSSQSADAAELELVSKTLNTLRDVPAYGTTTFQESEFQLIRKFLGWPASKLFPVLDILRLLILHPRAAEHYLAVHNGNAFLLAGLLDRLQISAQNPQANCMIALKFFANMFAHPALESVAEKNAVAVLEALAPLASTKDQRIKLPVANVVLNYSSILCDETSMTDGKRCALGLVKQMLQGEEDTETLYPLLIALGTLMYGDRESTTFVVGLAMEAVVKRHLTSSNAKIAEVAKDVLDLLKW